jgi:hypothetical protein
MDAMLSGRDHPLLERWRAEGAETPAAQRMLTTLGVKVFFDGARIALDFVDAVMKDAASEPEGRSIRGSAVHGGSQPDREVPRLAASELA